MEKNLICREKKTGKALLLIGGFGIILMAERSRPLRARKESKLLHDGKNLSIGLFTAGLLAVTENPLMERLISITEKKKWGLLRRLPLPPIVKTALGLILLDYTLFLWHILNHKWSPLWRFHRFHHLDQDLTATTGIRFHAGEMLLSNFWRGAQVILIGVDQRVLSLWQTLTLAEITFHHANLRLPVSWERFLQIFIVTPRLHTIHHSRKLQESNSNWSSGLTLWDRLHGTLDTETRTENIVIGAPGLLSD